MVYLAPMDKIYATREAALSEALAYLNESDPDTGCAHPQDDPDHGMWGVRVVAGMVDVLAGSEDSVRFLWPRFGKPLEARRIAAKQDQLIKVMTEAKEGLFASADNDKKRVFRACVYDLEAGLATIYETPLSDLRLDEPEMREDFRKFATRQQRVALGGSAQAWAAECGMISDAFSSVGMKGRLLAAQGVFTRYPFTGFTRIAPTEPSRRS